MIKSRVDVQLQTHIPHRRLPRREVREQPDNVREGVRLREPAVRDAGEDGQRPEGGGGRQLRAAVRQERDQGVRLAAGADATGEVQGSAAGVQAEVQEHFHGLLMSVFFEK